MAEPDRVIVTVKRADLLAYLRRLRADNVVMRCAETITSWNVGGTTYAEELCEYGCLVQRATGITPLPDPYFRIGLRLDTWVRGIGNVIGLRPVLARVVP